MIFTSVFAVLANTVLFQPLTGTTLPDIDGTTVDASTTAISSSAQTRLFVLPLVAYAILGVLFLIIPCIITATVYTQTRPSILHEEPKGLLSYAAILKSSDVNAFLDDIMRVGEKDEKEYHWWQWEYWKRK